MHRTTLDSDHPARCSVIATMLETISRSWLRWLTNLSITSGYYIIIWSYQVYSVSYIYIYMVLLYIYIYNMVVGGFNPSENILVN